MARLDDNKESSEWQRAHEALVQLAASRAKLDFEEGQRLRVALDARVHERLGYGSFVEYIERIFGYSPRLTYEKLRVAEALEQLPKLATALRDAQLSWSVVRELTRVATSETEHEWSKCAVGLTARQVQSRVSRHRPGSRPSDAPSDDARRHVLRFEVSGEAFAAFREATAAIRRDAGAALDDDATLLLLARNTLHGPVNAGRASYQLAITVCEKCQHLTQDARGEVVPLSAEIREMVACDAEHIGNLHAVAPPNSAHVSTSGTGDHVGKSEIRAHVGKSGAGDYVGAANAAPHQSKPKRASQRPGATCERSGFPFPAPSRLGEPIQERAGNGDLNLHGRLRYRHLDRFAKSRWRSQKSSMRWIVSVQAAWQPPFTSLRP